MIKQKSKSTVELIPHQFHQKFKDKLNFINKQGIVCPMFQNRNNQGRNTVHAHKQARQCSGQKIIQPTIKNRQNRILSLPRLKHTIPNSSVYSSKTTVKQKGLNVFLSGIKSATKPRLQLCR